MVSVFRSSLLASLPVLGLALSPLAVAQTSEASGPAAPIRPQVRGQAVPDFVPLVRQVKPAVVSIIAHLRDSDDTDGDDPSMQGGMPFPFPFPFPMMPMMPMMPSNRMIEARGSGFIISPDGYIVTNNHVVKSATKVTVKLDDGTVMAAKVIGRDPETDLALLQVKASGHLPYVELGNSDSVQPGQWIVAVGNPYGLGGTVTAGIVSALGRDLHSGAYNDFIQIDAPINRGNSGGPLITLDGKVVGVNSMIISPNGGGSIGIGFAIPSDTVRSVVDQLRKSGHVVRGYLGIEGQNITPAMARALHLDVVVPSRAVQGVLVASVASGSPAEKAGVKSGDVITTLNGRPVKNAHELAVHVVAIAPGTKVAVGVVREGKATPLNVTIGNMNGKTGDGISGSANSVGSSGKIGVSLAALTPRLRQELGLSMSVHGAVVTDVAQGSMADHSGIRPGDVILGVGNRLTPTPVAVASLVHKVLAEKQTPLLRILRNGQQFFVAVSPDGATDGPDDGDDGE